MKQVRESIRQQNDEYGGALISVVWAVLLLSLFALGILHVTLNARQTLDSVEKADADLRIAQSALRLFFKEHFYDGEEKAFRTDVVSVFDREVIVNVEFGSGRININRASSSLLSALFVVSGNDEETARSLADAIIDWRDKDEEPEPLGAETLTYMDMEEGSRPRNGPFETVGELRFVLGVNEDLLRCVRPLLTASSLSGDVELSYADERVRSVVKWAYDNEWDDVIWPNPDDVPAVGAVIGDANDMGGQTLYVSLTVPAEIEKVYEARVRFKSTSDRSFSYLTPVHQVGALAPINGCPW